MTEQNPIPGAPAPVLQTESPAPTQAVVDSVSPSATPAAPAAPAIVPAAQEAAAQSPPDAKETITPVPAPAEAPKTESTVLGADPAKPGEPDKAPAAPAPVETKKEEAAQSVEPAPLPTYEKFTLPEGITLLDEKLVEFTKELGEFQNLTKADQAEMQKFGQKLLDRHIAGVQETVKRFEKLTDDKWEEQKSAWKTALEKDPEIGGNRIETVTKEIVDLISQTSPKETHDAFRAYMKDTGIGNNPDVIRPIYNLVKEISRLRTKYESEEGIKPLPGTKPEPQATSKVARRYGGST